MQRPQAAILGAGDRLHLQHGPIDLIIGANADVPQGRQVAFEAAYARFQTILDGLVVDLAQHRRQLLPETTAPDDPVAQRMVRAARPFCAQAFVTPMIAVAGSVADEVLMAMCAATPLRRAYVNNGGDIAVHLAGDAEYSVVMAQSDGNALGRVRFEAKDGIRGIATSGTFGRSFSLGIADSVTVLAASAASADAAATLIANAVDLPNHPGITRQPADILQPDSDLGTRRVVTGVPALDRGERETAVAGGHKRAKAFLEAGEINGAALFLQGQNIIIGQGFGQKHQLLELEDV